jgi:hypothetical protein
MLFWATPVYFLCFLTSACCAWLLVRSYRNTKTKLLLWSAACFVLLALNNLVLFIDLVLLPASVDLTLLRGLLGLSAVGTLLYGFIWEVD